MVITCSILTHLNSQSALIFKVLASHKPKTGGTWWVSWLRHCATSSKVAGSIPAGVIGILHWHNPSGCIMALGSIQPLTEMSTTNISWGGECLVHTANSLTTVMCWLSWNQPPGNLKACTGFAFLLYKPKSKIYIHQLCTSIEKIWKSVHKTLQKSLQLCDGIHESGQWDNVDGQEERSSVCLLCHTGSVRRGISYCRQDIKTSPTRYQKSNYYDHHMMGWVAHWYRQADTWRILSTGGERLIQYQYHLLLLNKCNQTTV